MKTIVRDNKRQRAQESAAHLRGVSQTETFVRRFALRGRDPLQTDMNLYRYCGDDPVGLVDPTGQAATDQQTLSALIDEYYQSNRPADGGCLKVPVTVFFNWAAKQPQPDDNMTWINRCVTTGGCVGMCSVCCQNYRMPPNLPKPKIWNPDIIDPTQFGNPKCYSDQALAEKAAKQCPAGTHGFVWAKQGIWKDGKPNLDSNGQITNPGDLGSWYSNNPGGFNYISEIGNYYVGVDSAAASAKGGVSYLKICPKSGGPPLLTDVPQPAGGTGTRRPGEIGTMWCTTCVKD